MPVVDRIFEFAQDLKDWRRDFHKHPELAFEETRTADVVAGKLGAWGLDLHRGLAKTGVVGVLHGKHDNGRMIGLRADMDALPIQEMNDFDYASDHQGKMHACGHDGHTAMLLGAARYLAETRNFDGRIAFIFQPAEESGGGGAQVMIDEGLFEQFPVESVYGLHNRPGLPAGEIALHAGPVLAASDVVKITVTGRGGHAALPHDALDPVPIAAQIIGALQTISSRRIDPLDSVVVSITCVHAGTAQNVIPNDVHLTGSIRTLVPATRDQVETSIRDIAEGIARAHGASAKVTYQRGYPPTINSAAEAAICATVAADIVGEENIHLDLPPLMASEDFSYMLQEKPGCFIFLGNGASGHPGGCMVHNASYDFNDDVAVFGASYWARLAETLLPPKD